MAASVEEVSASLVREYLSRKGLKRTIACMDEERPRTEASINNRSLLRQTLNMESLYRQNKIQNSPLKTLLEIIVKHHIQGPKNARITCNESDHLQSAQIVRSNSNSYLETSTQIYNTMTEDSTTAFTIGKYTKSRSDIEILLPKKERLSSPERKNFQVYESEEKLIQPILDSPQDNKSLISKEPDERTSTAENMRRYKTNRIRRGMMAGPVASTPQESNKKRQNRRQEEPRLLLRKEQEYTPPRDQLVVTGLYQNEESVLTETSLADSLVEQSGPERLQRMNSFDKIGQETLNSKKVKSLTSTAVAALGVSEMVLDDIDDDDDDDDIEELSKLSFERIDTYRCSSACPLDQHTAMELKSVLLGSSLNCFNMEWRNQGFNFSEMHDLGYGIVQKKGGPCGVLASVQAFVLKKLLFENTKRSYTGLQRLRPSNTTRRKCLVAAAAEILWRAGEEKQAKIAIHSGGNHFPPTVNYRSEGVLEKITCFRVDNLKDLQSLLEQHIEQFETGPLGCILLTISAVLSRSIEKIRQDMDVPTATLIGAHGYCTQELVNLLLCGRAVSNVFDNDMELDSGNGSMTLLKGVKGQCDVGLLSLFEHYNLCKVGDNLKTPSFPIWVVCSESHFSVLFGLQRELLTYQDKGSEFDLYYYDGLANQHEEIRLTVTVGKLTPSPKNDDTDLIPPLEHCIRTRWNNAFVNWNDTEPIL